MASRPVPDLVVFDLDGTLADTLRSIAEAMNAVLREEKLEEHPIDAYRRFAGDGAAWLVKRATGHRFNDQPEKIASLLQRFRERDEKTDVQFARPYVGVVEALDKIGAAGVGMAVLSNKEQAEATALAERLFGAGRFVEIVGHDGRWPLKPDPTGLLALVQRARTTPSRTVYVGDTDTDMRTGRAAGVYTVGCSWGFRDGEELVATGADVVIAHALELPVAVGLAR
ncbi:MAG: HAD family hydrolase [Phycisphaerales bacterium]|nr:HAD family hydrolase [Phycisphaerales bacterium]